jgi:hypothetical protein
MTSAANGLKIFHLLYLIDDKQVRSLYNHGIKMKLTLGFYRSTEWDLVEFISL